MRKKSFEEKIEKFLNGDEFYRFIVLPVGERKVLVMEDRRRKKVEAFEKVFLELKTPNGYTRQEITKDTVSEFAFCYNSQGKVAVAVDGLMEYMGFEESRAKMMAMAVKDDKAVIFLYDSTTMGRVFMLGVTDMKKMQNLADFYKTLNNLGFCEGETAPYVDMEQEGNAMETKAGDCNGEK